MSKVGIIGVGYVGSTIAFYLATNNLVSELVLIDVIEDKAKANKLDIEDALVNLDNNVKISINDYSLLKDMEYLIIAYGGPIDDSSHDRLSELKITSSILKDIYPRIKESKFKGFIISITNPCDVIVTKLQKYLDYPINKIMGSGTLLDTNRLINVISNRLNVNTKDINTYIVREHGESQVPLYSNAYIYNKEISYYINDDKILEDIYNEAKGIGWDIFKERLYTNFGIAVCVSKIINAIKNDSNTIIPVSSYDKEYNIFYGWPTILNKDGISKRVELNINSKEKELLVKSINIIKDNVNI